MALTPSLESFLAARIASVEELEILLPVARGNAVWSPAAAAERLGMTAEVAGANFESLVSSSLVTREAAGFRYRPGDDETREIVSDLAREYAERRANVINVIYSANLERLRKFADAFRLRKP